MKDKFKHAINDGDVDVDVDAVREHEAKVVGKSALLTTTLPHMAETIAALTEADLRDSVKAMVGGAPVTAATAGVAVERAKELVG